MHDASACNARSRARGGHCPPAAFALLLCRRRAAAAQPGTARARVEHGGCRRRTWSPWRAASRMPRPGDTLRVVDLSDPARPALRGALTVPGRIWSVHAAERQVVPGRRPGRPVHRRRRRPGRARAARHPSDRRPGARRHHVGQPGAGNQPDVRPRNRRRIGRRRAGPGAHGGYAGLPVGHRRRRVARPGGGPAVGHPRIRRFDAGGARAAGRVRRRPAGAVGGRRERRPRLRGAGRQRHGRDTGHRGPVEPAPAGVAPAIPSRRPHPARGRKRRRDGSARRRRRRRMGRRIRSDSPGARGNPWIHPATPGTPPSPATSSP